MVCCDREAPWIVFIIVHPCLRCMSKVQTCLNFELRNLHICKIWEYVQSMYKVLKHVTICYNMLQYVTICYSKARAHLVDSAPVLLILLSHTPKTAAMKWALSTRVSAWSLQKSFNRPGLYIDSWNKNMKKKTWNIHWTTVYDSKWQYMTVSRNCCNLLTSRDIQTW